MFSGRKLMQTKAAERHRLANIGGAMRGETGGAAGAWDQGPKPEPEVRAAMAKREWWMDWPKIAKGLVAIFLFGVMCGLFVAGLMLPIYGLGWLFR